jgi:hypothetical protein
MMLVIDSLTMVKDRSAAFLAGSCYTDAPASTVEADDVSDIWADLGQS